MFGSTLGPGFHVDSDLDLAVVGLPAEALLEA
ncbi:MAG: nucleotidyltransferase domain-containing protein, partial [bacterium]